MALESLRTTLDRASGQRLRLQKEKWTLAYLQKYAAGSRDIEYARFRMALVKLEMPLQDIEEAWLAFGAEGLEQNMELSCIMSSLYGEPEKPDLFTNMKTDRYVPAKPAPNKEDVPNAYRDKKLRQFWDIVGHWANQRGFKTTRPLIRMMDKNNDGMLTLDGARSFFTTYMTTPEAQIDEWFSYLDVGENGRIDLYEFAEHIEPYLQATTTDPRDWVTDWEDAGRGREEDEAHELADILQIVARKASEKGFTHSHLPQFFRMLDPARKGVMTRNDVRLWFERALRIESQIADTFFDLVDIDEEGVVHTDLVRKVLRSTLDWDFNPEDVSRELPKRGHRRNIHDAFYEEIGRKLHQRGFLNENRVLAAMTNQTSAVNIDRDAVRMFFKKYLGYPTADKADTLFSIANRKGKPTIPALELKRHLAKCLGKDTEAAMERSSINSSGPPESDGVAIDQSDSPVNGGLRKARIDALQEDLDKLQRSERN